MSHWVMSFLLLTFLSVPARSAEVAFIEVLQDGKPVQLEPGGRFYHVAIRYQGQWLQAHPHGGVTLVKDIRPYGDRFLIMENSEVPEPGPAQVARWLGKPFDFSYTWDNPKATYCTRLVAELLGVPPQLMTFKSEHWKNHFHKAEGEPGLSPDKLFKELVRQRYKPSCEGDL